MADKKISELTGAGALTGTEEVPIVQSGVTVKTTTQDIADLGGGGGSFDPTIDQIGTITPANTPIDTDQTVNEAFSYAQGQIDELPNVVSLQTMAENNNTNIFTTDTDLTFDATFNDMVGNRSAGFGASYIGSSITSRSDALTQSSFNSIDGEAEITKQLVGGENTTITIDDPVAVTNWKVPAKADAGDYEFASTLDLADIIFDLEAVLENEVLESGLIWQVPNIDGSYTTGAASQYLRLANAPTVQNTLTASGTFGLSCGVLSTTASSGGIAFIRRNDAINLALYTGVETIRDFTVDSAITSGCRYYTGWSKNFQFSSPTNAEPNLQTECILVAKQSTSNNLEILHNDNTGTCTVIALGANFPANSNLYKYRVILQRISATDYNIQVIRKTLSDGSLLLSTNYNLTTNLPTSGGVLQSIHFITNNADATDMRLGDYGLIVKKISI